VSARFPLSVILQVDIIPLKIYSTTADWKRQETEKLQCILKKQLQ